MEKKIEDKIRRSKKPSRKYYIITISVLASLVLVLAALKIFDLLPAHKKPAANQTENNQNTTEERVPLVAYKVSRVNFEDSLNVMGNVEGGIQVELHFEKEGRISKINYKEGDYVKKGAVIASLDAQEAALKVEQARIEYDQHKKLYEAGIIIKAKLDQAKVGFDQAEVEYQKMILRAPFDGVISNIEQKVGEVVNPTKKIVSLFDTNKMVIKIGVTENDINKLSMDQDASVSIDAIPNETYNGKITGIDPNVDDTTRMMTLMVTVDNPESMILPGMFARVKINIYKEENALVVPSVSLNKVENGYQAFIIGEGNVVALRDVEVSYLSTDFASVSKGINEGEMVAVEKLDKLKDGGIVEILNVEEYTTHTPGKYSK